MLESEKIERRLIHMPFPLIPLALMSGLSIAGLKAYGKRSKGNDTAVAPPSQPVDVPPPPVSLRQEAVGLLNDLRSESQALLRRLQPWLNEVSALGKTTVETAAASRERVWTNVQAHLPVALRSDTGRDQQLAEMGVALRAENFRAPHAVADIRVRSDVLLGDRGEEAGPAGARFKFRGG